MTVECCAWVYRICFWSANCFLQQYQWSAGTVRCVYNLHVVDTCLCVCICVEERYPRLTLIGVVVLEAKTNTNLGTSFQDPGTGNTVLDQLVVLSNQVAHLVKVLK